MPTKLGEVLPTRAQVEANGKTYLERLAGKFTAQVDFLPPALLETWDDVLALEADASSTDAYLIIGAGRGRQRLLLETARRYALPFIGGGGVGLPPFLRSHGLDAFPALTDELITLLQAKKAFGLTRILEARSRPIPSCLSSAWDFDSLERRFHVGFDAITAEELFAAAEKYEFRSEAEHLADDLLASAKVAEISRDQLVKAANLYLTIKAQLASHGCTAFTPRCCEAPYLLLETAYQATPCLAVALLNDAGLPASCQGDISALLTVMVMAYLARKSSFMGNVMLSQPDGAYLAINHSAPGLKLEGFDAPPVPYSLYNFGVVDWGPALYVDMPEGQQITLARFDPLAERLLLATGELVKSFAFEKYCKQMVHVALSQGSPSDFLEVAHTDYGGHFTLVYGDYRRLIEKFGRLMGFEVVTVS